MLNDFTSVSFADGSIAAIPLPAFAVGWAVILQSQDEIVILARRYTTEDRSAQFAFLSAEQEFSKYVWTKTAGAGVGKPVVGATAPYWTCKLVKLPNGDVQLVLQEGDPMASAYEHIADRDVLQGADLKEPQRLIEALQRKAPQPEDLPQVVSPRD